MWENKPSRLTAFNNRRWPAFEGSIKWAGKRRRKRRKKERERDKVYPLCNAGGSSGLFFAFPKAAALREGDMENDRAL